MQLRELINRSTSSSTGTEEEKIVTCSEAIFPRPPALHRAPRRTCHAYGELAQEGHKQEIINGFGGSASLRLLFKWISQSITRLQPRLVSTGKQ
jgi:hypothetical protein